MPPDQHKNSWGWGGAEGVFYSGDLAVFGPFACSPHAIYSWELQRGRPGSFSHKQVGISDGNSLFFKLKKIVAYLDWLFWCALSNVIWFFFPLLLCTTWAIHSSWYEQEKEMSFGLATPSQLLERSDPGSLIGHDWLPHKTCPTLVLKQEGKLHSSTFY